MSKKATRNLLEELEVLETVNCPEISRQIAEARDKGDLSENAGEYDAAKSTRHAGNEDKQAKSYYRRMQNH